MIKQKVILAPKKGCPAWSLGAGSPSSFFTCSSLPALSTCSFLGGSINSFVECSGGSRRSLLQLPENNLAFCRSIAGKISKDPLRGNVVTEDQIFMDCKTGTVYKVKRVDGVIVLLETEDGRDYVFTDLIGLKPYRNIDGNPMGEKEG